MLTGVRPSGNLTIGNYLGAIKNFVDKQDEQKENIMFLADLHAITSPIPKANLEQAIYDCVAMYLACGVDPKKTKIFKQVDVMEHSVLGFIMTFQTRMGELSRMTQYKLKSQGSGKGGIDTGLFIYPSLMVADILAYNTRYKNSMFIVYDMGIIRDVEQFTNPFSEHDNIFIVVVKHW